MIIIKRELWKNGARVVARDKGKLITFKKWNQTTNSVPALKRIFKQNKTFDINLKKVALTNVNEFTRTLGPPTRKLKIKSPRVLQVAGRVATRAQYVITFRFKQDGRTKELSTRSDQFPTPIPLETARQQALDRGLGRLAYELTGTSDQDEAERLFQAGKITIQEGVVYYRKKS